MNLFSKLKDYFIPKSIYFFGDLKRQSDHTKNIVGYLQYLIVGHGGHDLQTLFHLISKAKESRNKSLKLLNEALITPVDKEAIGRVYLSLHWIDLSVKHLAIEMETYQIYFLENFTELLGLLNQAMQGLSEGFLDLQNKNFDAIFEASELAVHKDNQLIAEYAKQYNELLKNKDLSWALRYKEILSQIKEISKRMHFCAYQLEDIVYKLA